MPRKTLSIALAGALALTTLAAPPVAADPPPWAPAHGWRAKHRHQGPDVIVIERPAFYALPVGVDRGGCDRALISRELAGGLVGGALGGLAGAQLGSGSGQRIATVGGVLIGVLVGRSVGRSMDAIDQACVAQILERAGTGQTVAWRNPDTGGRYAVVPGEPYWRGDRHCREYTASAAIGGAPDTVTGVACRRPDGTWEKLG